MIHFFSSHSNVHHELLKILKPLHKIVNFHYVKTHVELSIFIPTV